MIGIKVNNWGLALKLYEGDKKEVRDFVEYEVKALEERLNRILQVKVCERCGKEYTTLRRSTKYCNRKGLDGLVCSDVGSIEKTDEVDKLYYKKYRQFYTYYKPERFAKWKESANVQRAKTKAGEIRFEEFEAWIKSYRVH